MIHMLLYIVSKLQIKRDVKQLRNFKNYALTYNILMEPDQ